MTVNPSLSAANDYSISTAFGCSSDLADGQKHGDWLGPIAEGATEHLDRSEAQGGIERDRIGFGIHDYTNATDAVPYLQSE